MIRKPSESPTLFALEGGPSYAIEAALANDGMAHIAGIDEAGRGPLAGPVVTAAVILDPRNIPSGLDDSKRLTAHRREQLFDEIIDSAEVAVAMASAARIDAMNIRAATLWAMAKAAAGLGRRPVYALIDGRDVPDGLPCPGRALVKGDQRSVSVAAASIIAKVTRDRLMVRLGRAYPAYGFERHMGYGTAVHRRALAEHGPCPHHRRSFAPVRQWDVELSGDTERP